MRNFLTNLRSFSQSSSGLAVVIILAVYAVFPFDGILFELVPITIYIGSLLVALTAVFAQYKGYAGLAATILLTAFFASGGITFFYSLIDFNGNVLVRSIPGFVAFMYLIGVIAAAVFNADETLSLGYIRKDLLFWLSLVVIYLLSASASGFIMVAIPIIIAAVLGLRATTTMLSVAAIFYYPFMVISFIVDFVVRNQVEYLQLSTLLMAIFSTTILIYNIIALIKYLDKGIA